MHELHSWLIRQQIAATRHTHDFISVDVSYPGNRHSGVTRERNGGVPYEIQWCPKQMWRVYGRPSGHKILCSDTQNVQ